MGASTFLINLGIIFGVGMDEFDFGTELLKEGFIDNASGTVGTVETDFETFEVAAIDVI